jgi:hypothetical protein
MALSALLVGLASIAPVAAAEAVALHRAEAASASYDREETTTPAGIANDRVIVPYGHEKHLASLNATYRVLRRTEVVVGYDIEAAPHGLRQESRYEEHSAHIKASAAPLEKVNAWIKFAHAYRRGIQDADYAAFLGRHTAACAAGACGAFENLPALRRFARSSRSRNSVHGGLKMTPHEKVMLGLDGSFATDGFERSPIGLRDGRIISATFDASFTPIKRLSTHGFFTYENLSYERTGHSHIPVFAMSSGSPAQPRRFETQDNVWTAGVGANWNVVRDLLDMSVDYTFTTAITHFGISSPLAYQPLPDLVTRLHGVGVGLDYKLQDNLSVRLGYRFEAMNTRDFQVDGSAQNTLGRLPALGTGGSNHVAHVVGFSMTFRF